MGLFKDIFKGTSSKDILGQITTGKAISDLSGVTAGQSTFDFLRGKKSFKEATKGVVYSGLRAGAGISFGAHLLSATTTRGAIKKLFRDDKERPPAVQPQPAVGAGTETAKSEARRRARQQAAQRFGVKSTVATSALGLQGQGATVGKKRLVGE